MQIEDLIGRDDIVLGLAGNDKEQALAALSAAAASKLSLEAATIVKALAARERLGSTGVGQGVAIPHARIKGLKEKEYFALFARLDKAVDFAAVDGKPVDLVFLLLMPENNSNRHIAALAAISRKLRDKTLAPRLRSVDEPTEIYELLTRNAVAPRA
jgi:PTS system nitrogen regulatory IIA component